MSPKEARKLVADALRSGKYKQGQYALNRKTPLGGKLCCLGVACEVFKENGGDLAVEELSDRFSYDNETACLPPAVQKWLGMIENGLMCDGRSLILMNDTYSYTFEQIADLFETAEFDLDEAKLFTDLNEEEADDAEGST